MISAILPAAGESRRMGRPKMLLPWGNTTVLGQVISVYQQAGVEDILVITGGMREQVTEIARQHGARSLYNERYAGAEMLSSVQCGLRSLLREEEVQAALIGLGDQPQLQPETIRQICQVFRKQRAGLIRPSFQMRRGHPWLVERSLWPALLDLTDSQSPRDFLNQHAGQILYVNVETPSILADLDTPQDYHNARPDP